MGTYLHTFVSILILGLLILLVVQLRKIGLLKEENGILFSKLVTHITLPSLIFTALASATIIWDYVFLFLLMFLSEIIILSVAWLVGKVLKLGQKQMGSFLLVSAFGSSSLLGYALIIELFPDNIAALAEGTFVSELGVGLALFTIGVMIAMYYGQEKGDHISLKSGGLLFLKSPIFMAIILGLLWSFSPLGTKGAVITPFFEAIHIIAKSNTFLVALTVGVLLNFSSLCNIIKIAIAVFMIKLILSPLLVYFPATLLSLKDWQLQVLLLEAAMPSAMLSVVLAKQYGCDAKLAAQLIFITLVGSLFTASVMIGL